MNKKLLGAVLGTLAVGGFSVARAEEAPAAKTEKPAKKGHKGTKGEHGKTGEKSCSGKAGGGEKSCGADGKSCSGKH